MLTKHVTCNKLLMQHGVCIDCKHECKQYETATGSAAIIDPGMQCGISTGSEHECMPAQNRLYRAALETLAITHPDVQGCCLGDLLPQEHDPAPLQAMGPAQAMRCKSCKMVLL